MDKRFIELKTQIAQYFATSLKNLSLRFFDSSLNMPQYIILITGTSSGFGQQAARHLALAGHIVYGSMIHTTSTAASSVDSAAAFAAEHNVDLRSIELDILSETSISTAVNTIIKECGRIDVLVHNAGHMCLGPCEAFTPEQWLQYYDINCVGPHRVNRIVLPYMRAAHKGLLVWVGSSSTRSAIPPFLGPYFAAKAGMDSMAVSYSQELSLWGIETSIVMPGPYTKGTQHFETAGKAADEKVREAYFGQGAPYEGILERSMQGSAAIEKPDSDPADVAKAIVSVVDTEYGKRPFRVHVETAEDGVAQISQMEDFVRGQVLERSDMGDLLKPKIS